MTIKMIVCDVDKTLIPMGESKMPHSTREILQKALAKGIKVMVNTGRHYTFLQESLFQDLPMDIIGTINGACLVNRNGDVLYEKPLSLQQMNTLVQMAEKYDFGLGFKFRDAVVSYHLHEKFLEGYVGIHHENANKVLDDHQGRRHHLCHGLPLGTFIIGDQQQIEAIKNDYPDFIFSWSYENAYDVFLKTINKADAVEAARKMYGIAWDEIIGFGDAGNDLPFLEKCRYGVLMGNAKEELKKDWPYVTDDCQHDGIAHFLEKYLCI